MYAMDNYEAWESNEFEIARLRRIARIAKIQAGIDREEEQDIPEFEVWHAWNKIKIDLLYKEV